MLLWDYELGEAGNVLDALSADGRAGVALETVSVTLQLLHGMSHRRITDVSSDFIVETLSHCRRALLLPRMNDADLEALMLQTYSLREGEFMSGSSLLVALGDCIDALPDRFSSDVVLRIMSACYEAVLNSQELGRIITVDMERANSNCVYAISLQRQILDNASR